MEKRRVAILGSTGSIGRQALDVIRQHRDLFEVELLTANNSSELLIQQAIEFDANCAVICNKDKYREVADALQPHYIIGHCQLVMASHWTHYLQGSPLICKIS